MHWKKCYIYPEKEKKKIKSAMKKSYTQLVILGIQKKKPANTEETAPIDNT
jgi:hypothetical protein